MGEKGPTLNKEQLENIKGLTKNVVTDVVGLLRTVDEHYQKSLYYEEKLKELTDISDGDLSKRKEDQTEDFRRIALNLLMETSTSSLVEKTVNNFDTFIRYLTETVSSDIGYEPEDFNESLSRAFKHEREEQHCFKEQENMKLKVFENESLKKTVEFLKQEIDRKRTKVEKIEFERQKHEKHIAEIERKFDVYKQKEKDIENQIMIQVKQFYDVNFEEEIKELYGVHVSLQEYEKHLNILLHKSMDQKETTMEINNGQFSEIRDGYGSIPVFYDDLSIQQTFNTENDERPKENVNKKNIGHSNDTSEKQTILQDLSTKHTLLKICQDDLSRISKQMKQTLIEVKKNSLILENERQREKKKNEDKISNLHANVKKEEDVITNLNEKIHDVDVKHKKETEEFENKIREIETKLQVENAEKGHLQTTISHLEKDIEEKKQEIEKWNNKLDSLTKMASKYENDSALLEQEKANQKQKIENLEDDLTTLKNEKESFCKQINSLRSELNDINAEHCQVIKQKNEEISKLQEELEEKKRENSELNIELTAANKTHKDHADKFEMKIKEIETKLQFENAEKGHLQTTISHLEKEIEEKKQEIEKWNNKLDSLTKMASKYENDSALLEQEQANQKQKIENLEVDLTTLKNEKESFCKQINSLRSELTDINAEHCQVIKQKNEEISKLQEELEEKKRENSELNIELTAANKTHKEHADNFEMKIKEIETKLQVENAKKGHLQTTISHLEKEIEEKKQEIEKWNNKLDSLTKMASKYENDSELLEQEKANQKQKIENLEVDLTTLKNEKESFCKQINSLRSELTDINAEHCQVIKQKNEEISKLQEELEEKKRENSELNIELTAANKTHKEHADNFEMKIKEIETKLQVENAEKGHLQTTISHLEKEIVEKKQEIEKWNNKLNSLTKMASKYENDSELLERERESEIKKRQELENQLSEFEDKCRQNDAANGKLLKEIHKLDQDHQKLIQEKDKHITNLNEKLKQSMIDDEKLNLRIKELDCKKGSLEQKILSFEKVKKELEEDKLKLDKRLNEQKDASEKRINTLENDKKRFERQMEMLRKDLNGKLKVCQEEKEVLKQTLLDKEHTIKEITLRGEETQNNLTNELIKQGEAHADEVHVLKTKENNLIKEIQSQRARLNQAENLKQLKDTEIKQLNCDKIKLNDDLEHLSKEHDAIRKELESIKSRKVIQVQLYCQSGVGLLSSVEDELKCDLKSKFDVEEGVDIDIIDCAKPSDIDVDIPLLILCIQASRLGTAVTTTVHGLNLTPKMAVLIFHHKDIHALPSQASERVLTQPELRNLGGIYDLAFLTGKGIYECDMNRANFISLTTFIKREGKRRLKEEF